MLTQVSKLFAYITTRDRSTVSEAGHRAQSIINVGEHGIAAPF